MVSKQGVNNENESVLFHIQPNNKCVIGYRQNGAVHTIIILILRVWHCVNVHPLLPLSFVLLNTVAFTSTYENIATKRSSVD